MKTHEVHIPQALHGERLDKALATLLSTLSRSMIKEIILAEGVRHHTKGVVIDPKLKVREDDVFYIEEQAPEETHLTPEAMDLDIVFEDDSLIVLNKPAGLVVHPGSGNAHGTLVNGLLAHCGESLSGIGGVKRPGIVHRLDKDTSGLMVVAKTDEAHQKLSAQFSDRTLSRTYLAFVMGKTPPEDYIDAPLGRSTLNRQKMTIRKSGGKEAQTYFKTLAYYGTRAVVASFIECRLETGRTHQIRVHLSHAGHPLIGDPTYGRARANPMLKRLWGLEGNQWQDNRQALHAAELKFVHPVTQQKMQFSVELPEDLIALQETLEKA